MAAVRAAAGGGSARGGGAWAPVATVAVPVTFARACARTARKKVGERAGSVELSLCFAQLTPSAKSLSEQNPL